MPLTLGVFSCSSLKIPWSQRVVCALCTSCCRKWSKSLLFDHSFPDLGNSLHALVVAVHDLPDPFWPGPFWWKPCFCGRAGSAANHGSHPGHSKGEENTSCSVFRTEMFGSVIQDVININIFCIFLNDIFFCILFKPIFLCLICKDFFFLCFWIFSLLFVGLESGETGTNFSWCNKPFYLRWTPAFEYVRGFHTWKCQGASFWKPNLRVSGGNQGLIRVSNFGSCDCVKIFKQIHEVPVGVSPGTWLVMPLR